MWRRQRWADGGVDMCGSVRAAAAAAAACQHVLLAVLL